MSNILSVENLSLNIGRDKLLKDISFEIKQGEIFALVGESGCGKSLTSLAIMRLLPDVISVSSGDIRLKNASLFSLPEYKMQKIYVCTESRHDCR
jgi:peptide/nickel transport system ATP-binding protein